MSASPFHAILTPVGSSGDVHPFIGLGITLKRRGHDVSLIASGKFRAPVEKAGLQFIEHVSAEEYERVTADEDLWHARRGVATVMKMVRDRLRSGYDILTRLYEPGRSILVGHSIALATRLFEEKHGCPAVTVHLAPAVFRSLHQMMAPAPGLDLSRMPRFIKRFVWWYADAVMVDPHIAPALNAFRAELGLPPIRRLFQNWLHSPQRVIGLFPHWFFPPQPDWPPQLRLTSFPLFDEAGQHPLSPDLHRFLAAGDKPIAFTPGSAMRFAHAFFESAIEATHRLGRRALLLTQYPDQLPAALPPHVMHLHYAPFSELLPRCAALVHHGGIGTSAQGLAAGVPQLVMPLSHDQPDNALRLKKLGVGDWLIPQRFTARRLAAKLHHLLTDPRVAAACAEVSHRLQRERGLEDAADLIEAHAAERLPQSAVTSLR